ncbi:MAG TPA: DNA polymerase ligase N-terminal domain-containing protein [Acidimicrobiales bacterium]|nr:DNA polymerase ligase N-terminal domain-containing protein [Acidimicrobiales bacterium]
MARGSSTERYREMRDFEATPEPAGGEPSPPPEGEPRFVIHQHDATRLHWDLRLEHEGALASWAIPRGIPWDPDDNHLAVHTEDHPIEYLEFSGEIPEGNYGAGTMTIWDSGTYEAYEWEDRKVVITLKGERAQGRYSLFATRGRDWMIHRMDPPADPARRQPPTDLQPMLAVPGDLPNKGDHAFEVRWVGTRVLLTSAGGVTEIVDAAGTDIGPALPEVRRIGRALGATEVILDGVVVALDRGAPSSDAAAVDRRLRASESRVRRMAEQEPLAVIVFDLLWLDGHPILDRPWRERRELLEDLDLAGPAWQTPAAHRGDGADLLAAAGAQGLPGLVAKRTDSPYRPGEKSDDWIEVAAP